DMDFEALVPAETGSVEIVEFSWPVAFADQVSYQCLAYCIMKRPSGFLLCVPEGFFPQEELDKGQLAAEAEGLGPSFNVVAPAVALGAGGEWTTPPGGEMVQAVVVDLEARLSAQVSPADMSQTSLYTFKDDVPNIFPLASEVIRQAREWVTTVDVLVHDRSGYQTAVSAAEAPATTRAEKAKVPKRPTVQQLAVQQSKMMELLSAVVNRLDSLQPPGSDPKAGAALPEPAPHQPPHAAELLQQPLSSALPPYQMVPKSLASVLGPPPPSRLQAPAAREQVDLEEQAARCTGIGEVPLGGAEGSQLTSAVLAQSQALVALVSQLSGAAADPLLETQACQGSSVRGSVGRAKLQQELAQRSGTFAAKIRQNLERKMDPTGMLPTDQVSYMRYLERHGAFANQPLLGLLAWQTAQCLDLLQANSLEGARDIMSLMFLMLDQAAQDGGDYSLAWLLTLQSDPPAGVFQKPSSLPGSSLQTFSPLAEQRWVTVSLAYVKELETIALRRAEGATLSKKQQRAAAWAAKKAVPGSSLDFPAPSRSLADVFPLKGLAFAEDGEFDFCSWVSAIPRLLRGAKTQFAHFIGATLSLRRDPTLSPSTALFPLPLCYEDVFSHRPCGSAKARLLVSVRRATHLVAMGLNFLRVAAYLDRAGLSPGSYSTGAVPETGAKVPHDPGPEALMPYGPIVADNVVLHGKGAWDLAEHLEPDLKMAFLEPEVIRFSGLDSPCASFVSEDKGQLLRLCKLRDASRLLALAPAPLPDRALTRIFGAFKAPGKQRQIGDRRGQNSWECRLAGPSRHLPTGSLLARIHVPRGMCLSGCVTDRRDFYTQAKVSFERSRTNCVGPSFSLGSFRGTSAYEEFVELQALGQGWALSACEGRFSLPARPALLVSDETPVYPAFRALLQGDAGGVEFATAGHIGLLQAYGCLLGPGRLQSKRRVASSGPWSGLIIDDFFSLSCEAASFVAGSPSAASKQLLQAKAAYAAEAVLGSDEKDVISQRVLRVAGAELDTSPQTTKDGLALAAYPVSKRLALAAASLRAAQCLQITPELADMLCGSWVACLMYRRCLMSVLDRLFAVGRGPPDSPPPRDSLQPLTRRAAGELQLLAVLAPVICSNLSAEPCDRVFATDASTTHGAVCTRPVDPASSLDFWLASDVKGAPVHLAPGPEGPSHDFLVHNGTWLPDEASGAADAPPVSVTKPEAFDFDFLEVGSSGGTIAKQLAKGFSKVGPLVDPLRSRQYDLGSPALRDWLLFLVSEARVRALLLSPPSASFHPALRPPLRSFARPFGLDPSEPATRAGNLALASCFLVFRAAVRWQVPAVLAVPASSLILRLSWWTALCRQPGVKVFGFSASSGRAGKSRALSLLSFRVDLSALRSESVGASLSSASRIWLSCPKAARCVASAFAKALLRQPAVPLPPAPGLENLAVNDLLCGAGWSVASVWRWPNPRHINVLESLAVAAVARACALEGKDQKVTVPSDSAVSRGAIAKGRSSSHQLRPVLLRICADLIAGGTYLGLHHAPTRLNVADDPTRAKQLRPPASRSLLDSFGPGGSSILLGFANLSASSAGWVRLSSLLVLRCSKGSGFWFAEALASPLRRELGERPGLGEPAADEPREGRLFDATLGFPGEGPLEPRHSKDEARRRARSQSQLPQGRPVLQRTTDNRQQLLLNFEAWLKERGTALTDFWSAAAELVSSTLTIYGRELFDAGYPYWHYAETINGVASKRPILRRHLQGAWDLAFSWMALEPHTHHTAMPSVVLLALLSVCLIWGWRTEAGIFGLCWGALLRIGEATTAVRSSLILPRDVLWTQRYVLLRIGEPKTRNRAARHQAAKLEPADLVQLVDCAFRHLPGGARLWPGSSQTLRRRLDSALERLGILPRMSERPLDLGSFRPGGATHMLQICEDSELVRRRGRWVSHRVMEIYLQEVAAATFYPSLPPAVRQQVLQAACCFPEVLKQSLAWTRDNIPTQMWYHLWP
ncbi:unnamed protein product, partial [Symbiodinium sp. KB8]